MAALCRGEVWEAIGQWRVGGMTIMGLSKLKRLKEFTKIKNNNLRVLQHRNTRK
jgi:hypothetical protein